MTHATISKARHQEMQQLKNPLLIVGEQDRKVYLVVDSERVRKFKAGAPDADLKRFLAGNVIYTPANINLTVV